MALNMDVSIIDEWPYLKLIVKLPTGQILMDKAVWHTAATQFAPKVQQAFEKAVQELVKKNKERRNIADGTTQR